MLFAKLGLTRKTLAACLFLAALAATALLTTPPPAAAERCGLQFNYYSDPGLTQWVGTRVWFPSSCGCGFSSSGSLGDYHTIEESVC